MLDLAICYYNLIRYNIVIVYGGYYRGLCDANMTLLTTGRLGEYNINGQFAFVFVCNNIVRIVSESIEKAKLTAELEKTKMEAEDANFAKSKFLDRVSHEIRTPINAIFGMNEMILRKYC